MSLQSIAAKLQAFATQVVADVVAEGGEVAAKLVATGKKAAEEALSEVEQGFEALVTMLGDDATKLVTTLMADDTFSGLEKANLAATQLTQIATAKGIDAAAHDVTALIKNTYVVVTDELAKL